MAKQFNLLERSVQRLKVGLDAAAAIEVEIHRQGEAITRSAVPGNRGILNFPIEELQGTAERLDWIVAANELVFPEAGKQAPERSWLIRVERPDQQTLEFEVLPEDKRCFRPIDPYGLLYRAFSKFNRVIPNEPAS